MHADDRRRQSGFTLVEILVVLVLIALIVGIGVPNLFRAGIRAKMLGQVTMIQQAIGVSRMHAIKNSSQVALQLLPDDEPIARYAIHAWVDTDGNGAFDPTENQVGRWEMTGDITIGPENDPPDGSSVKSDHTLQPLDGDALGVVLFANGTAMVHDNQVGTGQGAVVLADEHGNLIRILIQGGAGTVRAEMWDAEQNRYSERLNLWRY